MQLPVPGWVAGTAVFTVIAAGWDKIKWFFDRCTSYFIVRVTLERELARAISLYCWKNLRRSPFGQRRYAGSHEFVRPKRRIQVIGFESIGSDPIVFWRKIFPLFLGQNDNDSDDGESNSQYRKLNLSFIRGTYNIDKLIVEAIDMYNAALEKNTERSTRFFIEHVFGQRRMMGDSGHGDIETAEKAPTSVNQFAIGDRRILKWKLDDLGPLQPENGSVIGNMALPDAAIEMVKELKHWLASEDWHRSKGLAWKRSWMLYGPAGTGKTTLVRGVAHDLDLPIWCFDLASMSNEELTSAWRRMMSRIPCILLLEDLDRVFEGSTNKAGEFGGGMTFDCLLNCLDGVEQSNGIFVVITTNRVDKLDPALGIPDLTRGGISTRPGRVDRVLKLDVLDEKGRRHLAARIMSDCPERIDAIVAEGDGYTGAQFEHLCGTIASAEYWKAKAYEEPKSVEEAVGVVPELYVRNRKRRRR